MKPPVIFALTLFVSSFIVPASGEMRDLVAIGDAAASRFDEEAALKAYLGALKESPDDVYLHVAISREYRHLLSEAASDTEKRRFGAIAMQYAERAAALAPNDAEAQLAVAITIGKMLPLIEDTKEQLAQSKRLKRYVDRAIAIDADNDLAWHILGRWHRGIAEIGGVKRMIGSIVYGKMPASTHQNAASCFQRALKLHPGRLMHHVELGATYAKMGKEADAKAAISKGLAMKPTEKDDPATKRRGLDVLNGLR